MVRPNTIEAAVQSLDPGAIVTLYQLDATILGGPVYYFTAAADHGSAVIFGGLTYTPIDIVAEGFEYTSRGALPRPSVKISNVNLVAGAAVISYGDLKGATMTRIRTFEQFLDNGDYPDPTATLATDVYVVDRKVNHNKFYIEWELSASIDQADKQLPGRQVLRDACTFIYRKWDADSSSFVYTKATCPYTGTNYFDINGDPVSDPALDVPNKTLGGCCKKRFPNEQLPFGGFPGVSRLS